MSKRSLFWANASGKLGETVFYRAGGEQRNRTYVKNVKNPKTQPQALQRAKFNNMVAVFRGIKAVADSFFTRKSNQSGFNAFFSQNWGSNAWVANKAMCERAEGVSKGFFMANGALTINTSNIALEQISEDLESNTYHGEFAMIWTLPVALSPTNILGASMQNGTLLYNLLTASGNPMNLPTKFNVTAVFAEYGLEGIGHRVITVECTPDGKAPWRNVATPAGKKPWSDIQLQTICTIASALSLTPSVSTDYTGSAVNVTGLSFGMTDGTEANVQSGLAVIISYTDASGKQCTKSPMVYADSLAELANQWLPSGEVGSGIVTEYSATSNTI